MRSDSLAYALSLTVADSSTPDAELLARFADTGDAAAFELLVRRHAELVWRVCRSELPTDWHSAEDAFQTTFLVLARKARSVNGKTLAGYLFRVARNAALRVRKRIGNVSEGAVDVGVEQAKPDEGSVAVIEEVERLPDKFRLPVLLCFFEDCTHVEAANRLGWAVGTVASRLARAKDRLRIRLTHRGLALPAALAGIGVPALTVRAAVTMATTPSAVPTLLTELSREVLIVMAQAKAKWIGGGVLATLLLTGGLGMMVLTAGPAPDEPRPVAKQPDKTDDAELKKLQGVWQVTKIENNLGVTTGKQTETMRWEIVGSTITAIDGPGEKQRSKSRIALDGTKSPKRIAQTALTGPKDEPGRKIEGIYEVKGDKLRICFGEEGKEFPTEFKVEKGADMGLIELERVPKPNEKDKADAAELKKLQGKWRLIKMENERGVAPNKEIESLKLEIAGNEFSFLHEERGAIEKETMTIVLDSSKSPKEITLTAVNGPKAVVGKIAEGIYELKGDTFRISMADFGKPRPAAAELVKVAKARLMEFERIPKSDEKAPEKKVLTPDQIVQGKIEGAVRVEFTVESLYWQSGLSTENTIPMNFKLRGEKRDGDLFEVQVANRVFTRLSELGIENTPKENSTEGTPAVHRHFEGKMVRVNGVVKRFPLAGRDGFLYWLRIDSLEQIESISRK